MLNYLLRFTLFISLSSQLFFACRTSEDIVPATDPIPPVDTLTSFVKVCQITRLQYEGGYDYSFKYDSLKRLISSDLVYPASAGTYPRQTYSVEYDRNNRAIELINNNYDTLNKLIYTEITHFEYNQSGKLASLYVNTDTTSRQRLTFDTKDKLVRIDYSRGGYSRYEYNDSGNLTASYNKFNSLDTIEVKTLYQAYDDKTNPFLGLGMLTKRMGFESYSSNNLLSCTGFYSNGNAFGSASYNYTYNEKGFPLTANYTLSPTKTDEKSTNSKGIYTYQCD